MGIKDKDGKVYKLRGPNPIMKTQDFWDQKHVKLINFGWQSTTVSDERNPVKKFVEDYEIPDIGDLLEPEEPPKPEEPEEVPDPEPEELQQSPEPEFSTQTLKLLDKHKTMFHCVLAREVAVRDDLYGETYTRVTYGDKIHIPAVITHQDDLSMEFWSTKQIPNNSIVYPQDRTKRWWKVKASYPKTGGHVMSAIVSDVNPSF